MPYPGIFSLICGSAAGKRLGQPRGTVGIHNNRGVYGESIKPSIDAGDFETLGGGREWDSRAQL